MMSADTFSINDKKSESQQDTVDLEEKVAILRAKLSVLQRKRLELREFEETEVSKFLTEWTLRRGKAERNHMLAQNDYQMAVNRANHNLSWLNMADQWNVTNDCFHIWHDGPFGTINGLRLASEVPSFSWTPGSPVESAQERSWSISNSNTLTRNDPVAQLASNNGSAQIAPEPFRVPWIEINSALGFLVLLLFNLEKKSNCGITYKNKLVPQGSTSKIGIRKGESVTFYNLYSDDSFQFFGKRSFNIALNGLLGCLADAAEAVENIDRTMAMPYPVEQGSGDIYTIGKMSVSYVPEGEIWTRAMKYVLTNAKWLVAFTTKHVDR